MTNAQNQATNTAAAAAAPAATVKGIMGLFSSPKPAAQSPQQ